MFHVKRPEQAWRETRMKIPGQRRNTGSDTGEELGRSRTQDPASRQLDAAGPTGHDATPREFEEHVGGEEEAEANASRPHDGHRLDGHRLDKHHE